MGDRSIPGCYRQQRFESASSATVAAACTRACGAVRTSRPARNAVRHGYAQPNAGDNAERDVTRIAKRERAAESVSRRDANAKADPDSNTTTSPDTHACAHSNPSTDSHTDTDTDAHAAGVGDHDRV